MPKDPAINWYFDNWDGGTKFFTPHQKGLYMDLLSAQFHCGHLTLENIKKVLGSNFSEWGKCLQEKFEIDENGKFFNERIEHEITKRANEKNKKSEGGKEGMRKRWGDKNLNKILNNSLNNIDNKFLETGIETETKTVFNGVQGENKTDYKILTETEINQAYEFMFRIGRKDLVKDDILNFWQAFIVHKPDYDHDTRPRQMQHFRDWLKFQKKQNVNDGNSVTKQTKSTGASILAQSVKQDIERIGMQSDRA